MKDIKPQIQEPQRALSRTNREKGEQNSKAHHRGGSENQRLRKSSMYPRKKETSQTEKQRKEL